MEPLDDDGATSERGLEFADLRQSGGNGAMTCFRGVSAIEPQCPFSSIGRATDS